jgi:hypothetical protein
MDMIDPQPTLVELLVRHVLLPCALLPQIEINSIPYQSFNLRVIASDGKGWEHISVSLPNRCPNWREMCFIKSLFWDEEDVVIQYHPYPTSIQIPCGRRMFP